MTLTVLKRLYTYILYISKKKKAYILTLLLFNLSKLLHFTVLKIKLEVKVSPV